MHWLGCGAIDYCIQKLPERRQFRSCERHLNKVLGSEKCSLELHLVKRSFQAGEVVHRFPAPTFREWVHVISPRKVSDYRAEAN